MNALSGLAILALAGAAPAPDGAGEPDLRFGWRGGDTARVTLTDERRLGGTLRSSGISMRLTVGPDGPTERLVIRFSDRRVASGDQRSIASADPESIGVAVARVLAQATPAFVVTAEGDFVQARDLDATAREVMAASQFPAMPSAPRAFGEVLAELAEEDWSAWVALWRGERLAPGAWLANEATVSFHGEPVRVTLTRRGLEPGAAGRVRMEAVAVYPSDAVRSYTSGFLLDLAIQAKELGDDPEVNARFLERASFSPVTEKLTVDLEAATMHPLVVERERTFSAVAGKHWVEGRERRVHRFEWEASSRP